MSRSTKAPTANPVVAVFDNIVRTRRRVARQSRHSIEHLVAQVVRAAMEEVNADGSAGEYRFDDLARRANVSTRNLRSYREKGLLPPPRRIGRAAFFNDAHLDRLNLITAMLDRGFTINLVRELITAWEDGKTLGDVLGVADDGRRPDFTDPPRMMPTHEVQRMASDAATMQRLSELGLVRTGDAETMVLRPKLLGAFAELNGHGVDIVDLLDVHERVSRDLTAVSEALVEAGSRLLASAFVDYPQADASRVADLLQLLVRIRSIVVDSVAATFAESLDATLTSLLEGFLTNPPHEDHGTVEDDVDVNRAADVPQAK